MGCRDGVAKRLCLLLLLCAACLCSLAHGSRTTKTTKPVKAAPETPPPPQAAAAAPAYPALPVRAACLGSWLVTEGWILPTLFDGIPNKDLLDGTQVQFKSALRKTYLTADQGGGGAVVANKTQANKRAGTSPKPSTPLHAPPRGGQSRSRTGGVAALGGEQAGRSEEDDEEFFTLTGGTHTK